MIGLLELMPNFEEDNKHDFSLPFDHNSLPLFVKDPSQRRQFIKKQELLLTDAKNMENGSHSFLDKDASLHYEKKGYLGSGGFASVERITCRLTQEDYALKRFIRKQKFQSGSMTSEESFKNEIHNLRRLSHKHLIQYIGSFSDSKIFGILIRPIAENNLHQYLRQTPFPKDKENTLRTFFGCLANAISYLHRCGCRHKDIKPANVLILRDEVYISDFGLALDWSEVSKSVTDGPPGAMTPNYVAPEVISGEKRGSGSDMWSLGCVFLDILTVLRGETLENKEEFFMKNHSKQPNPRLNYKAFEQWMERIDGKFDAAPWKWTKQLLVKAPQDRIRAHQLIQAIRDTQVSVYGYVYYCLECSDDEWSEASPVQSGEVGSPEDDRNITDLTDIRKSLCEAVKREDLASVRMWLRKWEQLHANSLPYLADSDDDAKPLIIAASKGNIQITEVLLKYGFRIDAKFAGSAPLHVALQPGRDDLVDLLISHKAYINAQDSMGDTALHIAAGTVGQASASQKLLDAGADVNSQNKLGCTPLHLAVRFQTDSVETLMMANGIDLTAEDTEGNPPLHIAALGTSTEILMNVLKGVQNISMLNRHGETALFAAAASTSASSTVALIVELLIERGIDVNVKSNRPTQHTALHTAVDSNNLPVVKEILKAPGIHKNVADSHGLTPLHMATLSRSHALASVLLQNGFDPSIPVKNRAPCLHVALHALDLEMAGIFLQHGVDIDDQDLTGNTFLHTAMSSYAYLSGAIEFSLRHGANTNIQNGSLHTPLMDAIQLRDVLAVEKLLEFTENCSVPCGPNRITPLHLAAANGDLEIVQKLLQAHADASIRNSRGRTPEKIARILGYKDVVKAFQQERGLSTRERIFRRLKLPGSQFSV